MSTAPMPTGSKVPAAVPAGTFSQPAAGVPVTAPVAAQMTAIPTPSRRIPMPLAVAPPIPGVPALPAQAAPA